MIKIWGKLIKKEHILKSATINVDTSSTSFFDMLKSLCEKLNISTPVLLDKHVYDFNKFHMCYFKADDFIEDVLFDRFTLELVRVD